MMMEIDVSVLNLRPVLLSRFYFQHHESRRVPGLVPARERGDLLSHQGPTLPEMLCLGTNCLGK